MPHITGLHHVTAIAADPQANLDFYSGTLGMRLVKKTVNQDVPDTYHLFYADAEGHPGTDLTFFPWPEMAPGVKGAGLASEVGLAVPSGQPGVLVRTPGPRRGARSARGGPLRGAQSGVRRSARTRPGTGGNRRRA